MDPEDQNPVSDVLETVEQEALRNTVVLKIVAKNIPHVQTLKNHRLVNRLWNYVVSNELLTRDCLEVRLKFYGSDKSFYRDLSNRNGQDPADLILTHDYSLTLFCYWLESSQLFPSTTFVFKGGDLGCKDCVEFFRTVGSNLKTLSLKGVSLTSKETFQKLFEDPTFNIETLKIERNYFNNDMSQSWTLCLPKLKCLQLDPTNNKGSPTASTFVKALVEGAPILEKVDNFFIADIATFVQSGKVQTIQDVAEFGDLDLASLSKHTEFSNAQPTLKKISLKLNTIEYTYSGRENLEVASVIQGFTKILSSSQRVLTELTISDVGLHYSGTSRRTLQIQSLENLRKLSLFKDFGGQSHLHPHRRHRLGHGLFFDFGRHHFDENDILLNLDRRHFDDHDQYYRNEDEVPERPRITVKLGTNYPKLTFLALGRMGFQTLNPAPYLPSVETIEVPHNFKLTSLFTDSVQNICPNFKALRLFCRDDDRDWELEDTIRGVCSQLTFLQRLEIIVPNLRLRDFQNLDCAFTGLEKQACRKFDEESPTVADPNFRQFRKYPWLGNVTGLKNLNIFFESSCGWTDFQSYCAPPLTSSSGHYAFQLLPNLTVTIGYNANDEKLGQSLKSVSPFVTMIQL